MKPLKFHDKQVLNTEEMGVCMVVDYAISSKSEVIWKLEDNEQVGFWYPENEIHLIEE